MLLVPVVCSALFFLVFLGYLNSRPVDYGKRVDKGRNRLLAFLLSLVVLVALWWLLIYLASTGIFAGVYSGLR